MEVSNASISGANVNAAGDIGLTFSSGTHTATLVSPSVPTTIPAGGMTPFIYSVDVDAASATGSVDIDGTITTSQGTDNGAASRDSWTVVTPAVLEVVKVYTTPTIVIMMRPLVR